ncbi:hypothetical protein IV203_024041 [Nitzschia inconspicua]|uniref:Transmembrane protein n=1 Tax=Nitzschia inconspicua TaxID=303405 RepID=A0A9K3PAQ6_9STRA|nr:hypothetical protein IV203_024041 [Nitzschia inconspicua]
MMSRDGVELDDHRLWLASTVSSYIRHGNHLTPEISLHTNAGRSLTFLNTDKEQYATTIDNETVSDTGLLIGFSILSAVFFLVVLLVIRISSTCHTFYEWNAIRLLMPAVAAFLCMETATLAAQTSVSAIPGPWAIAVFLFSSTVAPGLFLFSFVITFLAYRTRSMPFCFVYRGPGRQGTAEPWRDDDEEVLQPLVRPAVLVVAIRLFALGLLILNLVVNFDVVWTEQNLAGRTGWATVFKDPTNPALDHITLALIPMALVSLVCLYYSLLLWRYGCELSLIIYSSGVINPWLTPVFGSIAMLIGQMFGPDLYLISSNSGILLYMLSMARVLYEARKDLEVSGELGHFLDALGNDNVTRTQNGLEKYSPNGDDDTLSSGQHQQWMLNESNNEIAIASGQDVEVPSLPVRMLSKRDSSKRTQGSSSSLWKNSSVKKNQLQPHTSLPKNRANEFQEPPAATAGPIPSEDDNSKRDSVHPAVTGAKDVGKLRRGQRPKGKIVVQ